MTLSLHWQNFTQVKKLSRMLCFNHFVLFQTHRVLSRPYIEFLASSGISFSICQVRWFSSCLNRFFLRVGQMKPNFLRIWFTCGVCFGLISMVMSVFLLSLLVFNTFRRVPVQEQVLTPVVSIVTSSIRNFVIYSCTPEFNFKIPTII